MGVNEALLYTSATLVTSLVQTMFSFHMKGTTDVTWLKHNGLTFINYLSVVHKRLETILKTNQRSLPVGFPFH